MTLRRFNPKAIFWGVVAGLISVVVTAVALIPVMVLLHWLAPIMGIPDDPNDSVRALWLKNVAGWMGLITGLIDDFVIGYVAGRVAKTAIYLNCGALIILHFLLNFPFSIEGLGWFDTVGFVLIIPATLFGGYIAKKMNQRIELRAEPPNLELK